MRLAEAEDLKVSEMALTGVSSKQKSRSEDKGSERLGFGWCMYSFAVVLVQQIFGREIGMVPWFCLDPRVGKQYAIYIYLLFMKGTLVTFMIHCEPVSCQDSRYTHSIHFKQQ